MTKRLYDSTDEHARQQQAAVFNQVTISLLLIALALLWTVISFLFIEQLMYRWITLAISASLIATGIIVFVRRNSKLGFNIYHTPIVETLLRSESVPLAILNINGEVMEMNQASGRTLGYHRSELIGMSLLSLAEPSSRDDLKEAFHKVQQGQSEQININIAHRSGYPLELQVICSPIVQEEEVIGIVVISHDLSDSKRNVERIRYMAYYDDMTGLPNRTLFQIKLSESLARAKDEGRIVGICYVDLDMFKLVNASFGREFGDMLLMQVADRLNRSMYNNDFAARMEGDEFALLFNELQSEEHLLELSRQMLKSIEAPYELKGFPIHITASFGLVTNRNEEDDAYTLIKKADMALIRVKESGKNDCLIYSDGWSNSSFERLTLQHEMYRAIERHEFELLYQPQYDLKTGMMVGVEALLRWNHPEKGLISPATFIPLAEESGMIVQIGDWVLEEACRQNKAWQDAGLPPMPVSVNLSIRQFVQNDLTGKVASILDKTGLESKYLDLEITESMTMDIGHVSRCLIALTDLGVSISVDDFGTGYSSFHYLKNFPIDRLKIDRTFVRDIQQDPGDAEIVAAIIAMAHNLNIQVIAEGVETEEQMNFLRRHKCDEMQGYYWSPPVSSDNIEKLLIGAVI